MLLMTQIASCVDAFEANMKPLEDGLKAARGMLARWTDDTPGDPSSVVFREIFLPTYYVNRTSGSNYTRPTKKEYW